MTIIERSKVIEAYRRAVELGADHEHACATVAQAMALPPETVHAVVTEQAEVQS